MDINWVKLCFWLLYNQYVYDTPISIILILTMTILFRKKSWKKCGIAFLLTFIICTLIYYSFFVIIYYITPPGPAWIFSMLLLKESIHWSFYIIVNLILWRLIMAFYYRVLPNKRAFVIVVSISFVLFALFYIFILIFEKDLFSPQLPSTIYINKENIFFRFFYRFKWKF